MNECYYPDWELGFVKSKHIFSKNGYCIICGHYEERENKNMSKNYFISKLNDIIISIYIGDGTLVERILKCKFNIMNLDRKLIPNNYVQEFNTIVDNIDNSNNNDNMYKKLADILFLIRDEFINE